MTKAKKAQVKQLAPEQTKLDEADFVAIQQHLAKLQELKVEVGEAELKKQEVLGAYSAVTTSFVQLQKDLEFKYGKVEINIETGEYKVKEEATTEDGAN